MANIPDEAILTSGELTDAAFRLYAHLCMLREAEGRVSAEPAVLMDYTPGLKRSKYFRGMSELKSKGWLTKDRYRITLLRGFTA